jgi:hypothetical protein
VRERYQQHSQHARALGLCLAMQMKGLRGRGCGRPGALAIGAARHRLQQLARILEIAAPQHRIALARQTMRRIGRDAVVCDDNALGRRDSALRAPQRGAGLACFGPANDWAHVHDASFDRKK